MRFLAAIYLLLSVSAFAEPIPARDPFFGESRPSWWWDIWHGRVVVLEGKITFRKSDDPDIRIEINKDRIKDIIPDDSTRKLQSKVGEFQVGELEISKFHYADAGASDSDGAIQQMQSGALKRVKVLIPIMNFGDNMTLYGMDLQPDVENVGIHVFDYSNLIFGVNLSYRSEIPNDSLIDANEVFKLRNKLVHCGTNRNRDPDPNRGYSGFRYSVTGDSVSVDLVLDGSPAHRGGLRVGDKIVSIQGQKFLDPEVGKAGGFQKAISKWKAGDHVVLEVQRGEKMHRVEFKVVLLSGIKERKKSEQVVPPNGP
jgi:hypothetical protein